MLDPDEGASRGRRYRRAPAARGSIPYRYAPVFGWFANTRGSNGKDTQAGRQEANAPHAVVPPVRHPRKLTRHAHARGHMSRTGTGSAEREVSSTDRDSDEIHASLR